MNKLSKLNIIKIKFNYLPGTCKMFHHSSLSKCDHQWGRNIRGKPSSELSEAPHLENFNLLNEELIKEG
jgi:hypothetical protein